LKIPPPDAGADPGPETVSTIDHSEDAADSTITVRIAMADIPAIDGEHGNSLQRSARWTLDRSTDHTAGGLPQVRIPLQREAIVATPE
jgi:hypothetical protein